MSARRTSDVPTATRQSATRNRRRNNRVRAYVPGPTPRKEAKVLDAGMKVEAKLERLINSKRVGVECWRRPGVRHTRLSGVRYLPDAAGYLPELEKYVGVLTPQVKGRSTYNVLFEFKSQETTGSAEKKISAAIEDMAHVSDATGAIGAVILHTPILTERQREVYKNLGRQHSVVVLEDTELKDGRLIAELLRVAQERRRLVRRIGPMGGYTPTRRPSAAEFGLSYRVNVRKLNGQTLRKYGADRRSR